MTEVQPTYDGPFAARQMTGHEIRDGRPKDPPFCKIETAVLTDFHLSPMTLAVYVALMSYTDARDEQRHCHPSHQTIAKRAGCSKNTAIRCIDELVERRLVTKTARPGTTITDPKTGETYYRQPSNIYTIYAPSCLAPTQESTGGVPTDALLPTYGYGGVPTEIPGVGTTDGQEEEPLEQEPSEQEPPIPAGAGDGETSNENERHSTIPTNATVEATRPQRAFRIESVSNEIAGVTKAKAPRQRAPKPPQDATEKRRHAEEREFCDLFADVIGAKPMKWTAKQKTAARTLIDSGVDEPELRAMIRWMRKDQYWGSQGFGIEALPSNLMKFRNRPKNRDVYTAAVYG